MADLKFDVDYSDLSRSLDVLMEMGKASKNTATAFEQSFRQIKRWQDTFKGQQGQINAQLETTHQKLQLANKSARSSAQAFIAHEKAVKGNTNALNRLRSSYDANYAAEQRTLQLKKLLRQEIANGNMTVREAGAELLKYRQNLIAFSQVQMAATKSSNRMGVVTQQAGYQVSDFIVQVQSGTNPFVAFSQQASQLAGVLPLVASNIGLTTTAAIALSAALGIAIPLVGAIGAAYLVSRQRAKEAAEGTDTFAKSLKDAQQASQNLRDELKLLASGYKDVSEAAFAEAVSQAEAAVDAAQKRLDNARGIAQKGARGNLKAAENELRIAEEQLETYRQRRSFLKQEAAFYDDILGSSEGLAAQERALNDVFESRLGTIDDTANNYEDILGSVEGLAAQEEALNQLYESRLGTIDDTYNNYEDILGSSEGLAAQEKALNDLYEARLGTIDDTFNNYEDILGSEEGLQKSVDVLNQLYQDRLDKLQATADAYDDILGSEAGLLAAEKARLDLTTVGDSGYAGGRGGDPREFAGAYFDALAQLKEQEEARAEAARRAEEEAKKAEGPINVLRKQLELEQALVGKTEARQRIIQALGVDLSDYSEKTINDLERQINKTIQLEGIERKRQEALDEAKQRQQEVADTISNSMENAMMSIVDGTKSVKDAFKSLAAEIIKDLYRIYVVKQITGMVSDAISLYTGAPVGQVSMSANGNVFSRGSLVPYANGGIVGSPTYFPMAGGRTGLMGEAGPEAIMPLKRGKNGKLGVQVDGGQQQSVVINQSFNFAANGDDSVKRIIAQQAPKIAQMTQQQIMDSRRRGGQMKAVFG